LAEITAVLATVAYTGSHLERLKEILAPAEVIFVDSEDAAGIAAALTRVDVAVLRADLDQRFLAAPQLRWIHCDHAGLNNSAKPQVLARNDLMVTGSAGRAAPALAQHALFFALALTYDVNGLVATKKRHQWRGLPGYEDRRGLYGKTMGVIGLGHTGRALVPLARACGMRVLGYGRGSAHAEGLNLDAYYDSSTGATLDDLLRDSDVVVLSIRMTDETFHLIGSRELQLMKPSAYLINIARGSVVDEAALVEALHNGTIAGAGLDVFENEPLLPDDAIWDAPNAVLTHHVTAEVPDLAASSLDIIAENVRRYRADEPLLNALKPSDLYTKGR
jgi:phosphoglycerate dehydrogenase-like enzyme